VSEACALCWRRWNPAAAARGSLHYETRTERSCMYTEASACSFGARESSPNRFYLDVIVER
jgi:hypothetical protein